MKQLSAFLALIFIFLTTQKTFSFTAATEATSCLRCHDNSEKNAPIIRGQQKSYLEKQLLDYKYGNRSSTSSMSLVALSLSDEEILAISDYLSQSTWQTRSNEVLDVAQIQVGKNLTTAAHCMSCHGNDLTGFTNTPRIAGQKKEYIFNQLKDYKNQDRQNDLGLMYTMTQFLTDENLAAIAEYVGSLK